MDTWVLVLAVLGAVVFAGLWVREARLHGASRAARMVLRRELEASQAEAGRATADRLWLEISGLASQEMLIAVDRQLWVRSANPAALQALGPLPLQGTLMTYVRSLELEELARESLESGEDEVLERVVRFGRRPFRARVARTPKGLGIALMDVAEMERLGRARQDMVANLSHELRTPLTPCACWRTRFKCRWARTHRQRANWLRRSAPRSIRSAR